MDTSRLTPEAAKRLCLDNHSYPASIGADMGLDLKLGDRPDYFVKLPRTPGRVRIRISSFRGVSPGAVHYYATIIGDGVQLCSEQGNGRIRIHGGAISEEWVNIHSKDPRYVPEIRMEVVRPLTQKEIDDDLQRWEHYDEGDMVMAFYTPDEALKAAMDIVAARFTGEWEKVVENDYYV